MAERMDDMDYSSRYPKLPHPGKCHCGASASWDHPMFGTIGGTPTVWSQCQHEHGAVRPVDREDYDAATQR